MRLLGYRRIGLFDNYGLGTAVSTFAIFAFALLALLCRAFAILTRCAVLTLRSFGATAPFANTLLASAHTLGAFALPAFALLAGAGGAAATVSVSTTCTSAAFLAFLLPHAVITKAAIATMQTSVNFFMVFKF